MTLFDLQPKTVPVAAASRRAMEFPDDLRAWFAAEDVLVLALAAVGEVDPARFGARGEFGRDPRCSAPMLCTLLTYCYALGRYASEEIEGAVGHDPVLRYLCANQYPTWQVLRRFRRVHRPLLSACLARLIRRTWTEHGLIPPALDGADDAMAMRAVGVAEELLERAVLADMMAADV